MRLDTKLLKSLSISDRREARRMFCIALKRYVDPLDYFRTMLSSCELALKCTPLTDDTCHMDIWTRQIVVYRACVATMEIAANRNNSGTL